MFFKALCKGDIIQATDYVAREDTFNPVGRGSIGKPWNKTAYYRMYRLVESPSEGINNSTTQPLCIICKNKDICEAMDFIKSPILDCKRYRS
jgi:hypothetical protein